MTSGNPCNRYDKGSKDYFDCLTAHGIHLAYVEGAGGGNPYGEEAAELVQSFINNLGFGDESQLPEDFQPNPETSFAAIDGLRDLGELETALGLSDVLTSWLTRNEVPAANQFVVQNLTTRAKILNGLGQQNEACHMLDLAHLWNV